MTDILKADATLKFYWNRPAESVQATRDLFKSGYDLRQYQRIKDKYPRKKGLTGNELLFHMKKSDKLTPVITLERVLKPKIPPSAARISSS